MRFKIRKVDYRTNLTVEEVTPGIAGCLRANGLKVSKADHGRGSESNEINRTCDQIHQLLAIHTKQKHLRQKGNNKRVKGADYTIRTAFYTQRKM